VTTLGGRQYYLQTSPEFAMKRLLAAGSGAIYQLGRAFRDDERGPRHNPEFTLLEWYRPDWDHHALMKEVETLCARILDRPVPFARCSYRQLFVEHAGIDPAEVTPDELNEYARRHGLGETVGMEDAGIDDWLDLILTHVVEPSLAPAGGLFVYDFPATKAALAQVRREPEAVAERFELYVDGIEVANGYHELRDAVEQAARFDSDRAERRERALPDVTGDGRLLAALDAGLPPCAGVALGVERLVMLATGATSIDEVMAFTIERA
jgi:lysyl-tRNA synthetase class 2